MIFCDISAIGSTFAIISRLPINNNHTQSLLYTNETTETVIIIKNMTIISVAVAALVL